MFTVHNRRAAMQALSRLRHKMGRLSLQGRFLLIMGASSLFITLLFWALFNSFTEQLIERIGARFTEKQMLYDKARTLQPLMQEIVLAREYADSPLVKEWAIHERDPELFRHSMEGLRNRFHSNNFFVAIAKSGNFYYHDASQQNDWQPLRYALKPSNPDDAWIFDFIKSGSNHGVNASANNTLGVNKIWIMVSIKDGSKVVGVLGTGVDLGEFTRNASNIRLPGVTNMFIDRNASIQVYNDVSHFDFPGIEN